MWPPIMHSELIYETLAYRNLSPKQHLEQCRLLLCPTAMLIDSATSVLFVKSGRIIMPQ